jgi:signal transduction histidine kinase
VKRIEVAIKAKEDLAKVNAQMEKFLYSTSHDLRSPLTSILGLVNLMRMEKPNHAVLDYANKIEGSVNRLDEIIKDIMRFSKNSYQRLQSEKILLEPLIWKIINTNINVLEDKKRIKFEVFVEENETFYSDVERLETILTNIIRNAIVFFDPNKSRPFVTLKANAKGDEIKIQIIDNGIGIGKTHLDSIFNMFYRATDRAKGAGLGLFVAKEAVERLRGEIHVESEIGFGSMFRITIPNDSKGKLVSKKLRLQEGNF